MELREAILGRRSVRKYTDEPVSREDLEDIVRAGMHAPSACNSQCWRFIVLSDRDEIGRLAETVEASTRRFYGDAHASEELIESRVKLTTFFRKAPAVVLVFDTGMQYHDSRVTEVLTENLGMSHEEVLRTMGNPTVLSIGACVQNMLLAAEEKGLGACWQCDPVVFSRDVCEAFGVEGATLASVVSVGHPAQTPRDKAIKPFEEVCTVL